MRGIGYRGKFERKNILFYKLDLNKSLIFMLTESKNKVAQPKCTKGGSIFSFSLITRPTKRVIIGKFLSWNGSPQNLEIKKYKNWKIQFIPILLFFFWSLLFFNISSYLYYVFSPSKSELFFGDTCKPNISVMILSTQLLFYTHILFIFIVCRPQ